jgi:hypothetical protein
MLRCMHYSSWNTNKSHALPTCYCVQHYSSWSTNSASSLPVTLFLHYVIHIFYAFSHLLISSFPVIRFSYYVFVAFILRGTWSPWITIQLLYETSIYKQVSFQFQEKIQITMRSMDLKSWKMCDYERIFHFHYCFRGEFVPCMQSRLPDSLFCWSSTYTSHCCRKT